MRRHSERIELSQGCHSLDCGNDARGSAPWAHSFNDHDGSVLVVDSVGTFKPQYASTLNWAEYGVRVGYKLNQTFGASIFVNGVAGDITGSKAHIGGSLSATF